MDKRIWIVSFIIFINMLGVGLIFPLLPYYAESLGASVIIIGFLGAMYPLFQLLSAPLIGDYSDRHGRRPALLFSLAGTVLGFVFLGIGGSLPILFLARIIDGASAGNFPIAYAYIADITKDKQRTQAMSLVNVGSWLGFVLGPAFGGILSQFGYGTPSYAAAAISFLGLVLAYFYLPETREKHLKTGEKKILFSSQEFINAFKDKKVSTYLFIALCIELALWLMNGTIALFVKDAFGFTPTLYGYFNTYYSAVGIATQLIFLRIILKYLDEKDVFILSALTIAFSLFLYAIGETMGILLFAATLFGVGSSVVNPLLTGIISKGSAPEVQGNRMGVVQTISSIATLIGPIVATSFYSINIRIPYLLGALVSIVAVIVGALASTKYRISKN